jgi:hypothetical protein
MTNAARLKQQIAENAREIARLDARIRETCKTRDHDQASHAAWKAACTEFHTRYNELALPGGYVEAEAGLQAGDPEATEAVLCFLELRPYFFRSGYMHQRLLRKIKRSALHAAQVERLNEILRRAEEWKARRRA